ncbi:hypothetical protein ABCR94_16145 [Streptomyces sp. 21So2-11]|uniref:hypothetical protein n=1 Tax=Streptomyces sp. 21So2-11 TaxID=3144408 RepID=UPI00321B5BB9
MSRTFAYTVWFSLSFGRGFPAGFAGFLGTLEVIATSRFPDWEPASITRVDDIGVRKFTGNLHVTTRDSQ